MMKRSLGKSGIEVSAVGMGCWSLAGITYAPVHQGSGAFGWGKVEDSESISTVHAALDSGITLFDTADVYGGGHSERILGQALAGHRDKAVIATKFGWSFDPYTRQMLGAETSPGYIRRACEGSLHRLQTDYIDVYQLHIGEYDPLYLDDIIDVLDRLVDAGKIRSYGWVTGNGLEGARVFAKRKHCAFIQHRLNLLEDSPQILEVCEQHGVASVNLAPLAMSLLTGKFTKDSKFDPSDVRGGWNLSTGQQAEQLQKLEQLREILTAGGRTVTQGALGWILRRSNITVPIPGCKNVKQAQENAAAMQFGPLSNEQMAQIAALLNK